MKIIEKIEIKNFRSFLGTRRDDKAEVFGRYPLYWTGVMQKRIINL